MNTTTFVILQLVINTALIAGLIITNMSIRANTRTLTMQREMIMRLHRKLFFQELEEIPKE